MMKLNRIFALMLAGASLTAMAQTHVEGEEYYKADQLENAQELLQRSLNNPGTDKSVSDYYLGMIALDNNKLDEAAKYFASGVSANANNAYNYVGQGYLALKKGDVKTAEDLFKQADKLSKKDPSLQIAIARAYDNADPAKYSKQIAKQIEKARKFDKNNVNPDIYIFEGDQLKEQKDFGGAGAKYEMATTYDPNATAAYVKYANLFTQVNPDYAITMLKKLLQINPSSALGQRELANAYYNKSDYKNAATEYGKYVTNPAHFRQDENRYAFLLFYGGDFKKGYDYASQLLAKDPKNFTAQRYQFMNAAQIPDMKEQLLPLAEKLWSTHKADPANNRFAAIDYTLIADELDKAKRVDEAVDVLKEGIKDLPENASFNKQLAFVYVDQNDLAKASDAYKGYLEKTAEPSNNDYMQQAMFSFYAGVQNQQADPAKANEYFEDALAMSAKAAEINPQSYSPKKMQGDVAKQRAPKDQADSAAVPYYVESLSLLEASDNPARYARDAKDMYMYLGNYYYTNKIDDKAKQYFNGYLKYDPENATVKKFVEGI